MFDTVTAPVMVVEVSAQMVLDPEIEAVGKSRTVMVVADELISLHAPFLVTALN